MAKIKDNEDILKLIDIYIQWCSLAALCIQSWRTDDAIALRAGFALMMTSRRTCVVLLISPIWSESITAASDSASSRVLLLAQFLGKCRPLLETPYRIL